MDKLLTVLIMIIVSAIGAFGAIQLKIGSTALKKKNLYRFITNKNMILGIMLYAISAFITILCLKYNELSLIYPLTSITYIFTIFLSAKLLEEKITKYKWAAITLIIAGNLLVTMH